MGTVAILHMKSFTNYGISPEIISWKHSEWKPGRSFFKKITNRTLTKEIEEERKFKMTQGEEGGKTCGKLYIAAACFISRICCMRLVCSLRYIPLEPWKQFDKTIGILIPSARAEDMSKTRNANTNMPCRRLLFCDQVHFDFVLLSEVMGKFAKCVGENSCVNGKGIFSCIQ